MATNPLLRYGAPKQIACTIGVTGDFPAYTSGAAYTGTVSIAGAQGATTVGLVPPGTDASGGSYVPLVNPEFAAGAASWTIVNQLVGGTVSFQAGAGRTAAGFLRWQPTSGAPNNYFGDTVANTTIVQSTGQEVNVSGWVRCTAIGPQPNGEILDILIGVQVFNDAAATSPVDMEFPQSFTTGASPGASRRVSGPIDWFLLFARITVPAGKFYRLAFQLRAGTSGTIEIDDCQWDARGVPQVAPTALGLPAGFSIDTLASPDRVRVQWPATAAPGASTLANLDLEAGDSSYLKGAGWAITNAAPTDAGSWSAKYSGLGQSSLTHLTMAPVTPGTSITASCRVSKGNNRKDFGGGAVLLEWLDANTRSIGFNVGNVVNTGTSSFQTSSVTATAPAGAAFVRLGASGTRDVKGRASDIIAVDTFAWNHTFALGGSGAGAPTGPLELTFRVTDSVGCSAVATRTIGQAAGTQIVGVSHIRASQSGDWTFPIPGGFGIGDTVVFFSCGPNGGGSAPNVVGSWPAGDQLSGGSFVNGSAPIIRGIQRAFKLRAGDVPNFTVSTGTGSAVDNVVLALFIPSSYVVSTLQGDSNGPSFNNNPEPGLNLNYGSDKALVVAAWFGRGDTTVAAYPFPNANVLTNRTGSTTSDVSAGLVWNVVDSGNYNIGELYGTGIVATGAFGLRLTPAAIGTAGPSQSDVVSLLHFDGTNGSTTFTDDTGRTWTANGNAQLTTAQRQFGTASGTFDGTGDFLSTADSSDWAFGTGDFTVDLWVRPTGAPVSGQFDSPVGNWGSSSGWCIFQGFDNRIYFNANAIGIGSATPALTLNTWQHVAVVRASGTATIYVNGVSVASGALATDLTRNTFMRIGANANTGDSWNGQIDEVRIIKGRAVWTANFTPPSAPYTL